MENHGRILGQGTCRFATQRFGRPSLKKLANRLISSLYWSSKTNEAVVTRRFKKYALFATLALALALRLPGIEWGLPPTTPEVRLSGFRSSYAFDEGTILSAIAEANTDQFDLDPRNYHWGTLHLELVLLTLDGAQVWGAFHVPWRSAYYNLVPYEFVRVYVVGRLVAIAAALFTIWLLFRFPGLENRCAEAGMFAAMLVTVSPSHILQSDQVRVDVTMASLLVLTLLAALRTHAGNARQFLLLGIAAGLAIAAKYSVITAVGAIAVAALILQRLPWRGVFTFAAGSLLGFVLGGPYVAIKPRAFYDEIHRYYVANQQVPPEFIVPSTKLLAIHAANLARFSLGLPAFLLAIAGLAWMLKRRSATDWIVLAGIAGSAAILIPLRWPLIRYDLPLLVLLALCAGIFLERVPGVWRYSLAAVALAVPLAASITQIHYMRAPHPANVMLPRILEMVPPGSPITRLFRESPPLTEKAYPLGPKIFLDDLTQTKPGWVLMCDLPDHPYKPSTLALLKSSYQEVASAKIDPILSWATLGTRSEPHDWKYTHPTFTLYRKNSQ
jgi:Dolichyl-phosphate-mannose-protein mannosyltransferase